MSLASGLPINTRRLADASLTNTTNFAAGGSTANGGWINLGQPGAEAAYWNQQNQTPPTSSNIAPNGPYVASEKFLINLTWTASTNGVNTSGAGGNISFYLQQTDTLSNGAVNGANFSNMPLRVIPYATAVNGALAAGAAGPDFVIPNCPQWIRVQAVSGANVGNAADASFTLSVLF